MTIRIHVTGPDADEELKSFYAWLLDEPDIRQYASVSLMPTEPGPSEMGAAFEIIQLVVDSGFQMLNLALAYANWRATRPSTPQVTIERGDAKLTVADAEPETVQAIIRAMR